MSGALRGLRVGFFERPHPPGYRSSVTHDLIPRLRGCGAQVDVVHAERGLHRLDTSPPWDLVVLKSGSASALHLAAAAEGWGTPSVNRSEATRLAQDRLASAAILQRAGLPIASSHLAWLGANTIGLSEINRAAQADGRSGSAYVPPAYSRPFAERMHALAGRPLIVKAGRGSRGAGLWIADTGELPILAGKLPAGPYLIMERVSHAGDDLKVFVAGDWMAAIERPFPATTFEAKLGRPVRVPSDAAAVARQAGRILGLTCFGCDFVRGCDGWMLVDINAFPGYKGAAGAPEALGAEISRIAKEVRR